MAAILTPCTETWGQVELRNDLPEVITHRDVVYVPHKPGGAWGIFGRDGCVAEGSVDLHGPKANSPDQLMQWDGTAQEEAPDATYVYAGVFNPHYGHFLVNSLSRLWPLAVAERPVARLLVHASTNPADWFTRPFVRDIYGALGLTQDDLAVFTRPTRIRTLIVPHTSFQEQRYIHRVYAVLGHRIGAQLLRDWAPRSGLSPVYLSKTRLLSGVGRIVNEAPLQERLEGAGIEIIQPETLSLRDQVALFAERPVILGTTGSSFHSSIFVPPQAKLILLSPIPGPNSNFQLVDAANGNNAQYFHPPGTKVIRQANDPFLTSFQFPDPVGVADALLDSLNGPSRALRPTFASISDIQQQSPMSKSELQKPPSAIAHLPAASVAAVCNPLFKESLVIKRSEVVQGLLSLFELPSYLEIGVFSGDTFFKVDASRKVAVDPQFQFDVAGARVRHRNSEFHEVSSDSYFGKVVSERDKFHVIYLDGLHTLEQTLRDFTNSLEFLHSDGIILIDDILPRTYFGSLKNMETAFKVRDYLGEVDGAWMGDTYRLAYFIDSFFQQYSMRTISDNEGQLVVWKSRRKTVTERSVEQVGRLAFEEIIFQEATLRKAPFAAIVDELKANMQAVYSS